MQKPTAMKLLLSLTTIAALPLSAGTQTFDFKDPKGVNNATFTLDAPLETITGSANGVSGTVTINPENPAETKGTIVIDASTLHVENPVMKEHLHSDKWMNTAAHKVITFTLASLEDVKQDGDVVEATVKGTFRMLGQEKEIAVPVKVTLLPGKLAARTNGQMEGDLMVIRSTFVVKRSDFGINPEAPADKVADEITINLAIAGAFPKS
jgi:polyisoprenoid-binding protein YceI